jgi:hypothetical protein
VDITGRRKTIQPTVGLALGLLSSPAALGLRYGNVVWIDRAGEIMGQSRVQFAVSEIVHPSLAEVLCELYSKNLLQGEVITTTKEGRQDERYFVVRVPHLSEPVIVPVRSAVAFVQPDRESDAPLLVAAPEGPVG